MPKPSVKEGDIFTNTEGCQYVILRYTHSKTVLIQFLDTDSHKMTVETGGILRGNIKNPFHRRALGIGYMGVGIYSSGVKESPDRGAAYKKWKYMLERCYGSRDLAAYQGCVVCEEWHNFQNFANWAVSQKGFGEDGWHLDKDILSEGRKIYSPETCAFVPVQINSLIIDKPSKGKSLPCGVIKEGDKFLAYAKVSKKRHRIGLFETCEEAESAYKQFKKLKFKELVEFWKGQLDKRVYLALVAREF